MICALCYLAAIQAHQLVSGPDRGRGAVVRGDGVPAALRPTGGVPSDETRFHPDVHPGSLLDDRLGGWAHVREV